MAVQARLRIGRGEDQGIFKVEVDSVYLLQNKRIGVQDFDLGQGLSIRVHASAEGPVLICHTEAFKCRGGIEALQMEGEQGGRIRLFPGCPGEDHRHQQVDQLPVLGNDGLIGDRFQQLRGQAQLVLHHTGQDPLDGMLGREGLLPEGNEWRQTQCTGKREGHRRYIKRKARVQRHERSVLHDLSPVSIKLSISTMTIETGTATETFRPCHLPVAVKTSWLMRYETSAYYNRTRVIRGRTSPCPSVDPECGSLRITERE